MNNKFAEPLQQEKRIYWKYPDYKWDVAILFLAWFKRNFIFYIPDINIIKILFDKRSRQIFKQNVLFICVRLWQLDQLFNWTINASKPIWWFSHWNFIFIVLKPSIKTTFCWTTFQFLFKNFQLSKYLNTVGYKRCFMSKLHELFYLGSFFIFLSHFFLFLPKTL